MNSTPSNSLLDELIEWTHINSGTFHRDGVNKMRDILYSRLIKLPLGRVESINCSEVTTLQGTTLKTGDTLRYQFNPKSSLRILLSGHYDTVYSADSTFQKTEFLSENKIKGPGITDMKGGLIILIEAVDQFLKETPNPQIGIDILITADEEVGSLANKSILAEAAREHHIALVFESGLPDGALVRSRFGTGTFKISAKGIAAHSGRDFKAGVNAIVALSSLLTELHHWNDLLPELTINIGQITGGGALNIVPDAASAFLSVRSASPEAAHTFTKDLRDWIALKNSKNECQFNLSGEFNRLPMVETKAAQHLYKEWITVEKELGYEPSGQRDTGGSSDGNLFAQEGTAVLDGLGIRGDFIHSNREYAIISSIDEQIAKTKAFLKRLNETKISKTLSKLA